MLTWVVAIITGKKSSMVTHNAFTPSVVCYHCVFNRAKIAKTIRCIYIYIYMIILLVHEMVFINEQNAVGLMVARGIMGKDCKVW